MVPSVLIRCSGANKRHAAGKVAATFPSPSKTLLVPKDAQRNPIASTHREMSSSKINYLDIWMGSQKRQPLAPAAAMPTIVSDNAVSSAHGRPQLVDRRTHHQLPVFSYHLYTLRPNLHTDPKALMQTLTNNIIQTDQSILHANIPRTLPIVLDMSAFCLPYCSPSPEGTMKKIVNTIISHANENKSNVKFCIVGITNLPPSELKDLSSGMMFEAHSMNLPLLQNTANTNHQLSNNMPPSSHAPESSSTRLSTLSHSPQKKKRGGVAPLLRPRRPLGSTITHIAKTSNSAETGSKTKDVGDIREAVLEDTKQLNFLAAPFRSEGYHPSTKVHKGSIRSGQLVTSDYPNQSLVIIGSINPGGEVWSEGDVFVFGKLRGRVLAGLRDVGGNDGTTRELSKTGRNFTRNEVLLQDESETKQNNSHAQSTLSDAKQGSRIFATSFDPELVCIGGKFCRRDFFYFS